MKGATKVTKYKVTIDNREYEVTVEKLGDAISAEEQKPQEIPKTSAPKPQSQGTKVPAPLSGAIISVKLKPGDRVKKGDVLLSLEALKLENEITAPVDGELKSIVAVGESVETGDTLAVIG